MTEKENEETQTAAVNKNKRYRKDKPWDNDPTLDKWKIEEFKEGDMAAGCLLETSSFSVLFPQYREKYIDEVFPFIKMSLKEFGIKTELDKLEGSLSVSTTSKTWDPYAIIKARDMVKLIARSVPLEKAKLVLQDGIDCDVIKIRQFVKNKERFIKRRQRLIGPKGMTLKALELLTECYILVQGSTVSVIGKFRQLKTVRRIVLDCMQNVHPVYHIKELMIMEQLKKDPAMINEDWDRYLPQFKKRNVKRKSTKPKGKKKTEEEYNPFPPEQKPRKIDKELETGEYWQKDNNNKKSSKAIEEDDDIKQTNKRSGSSKNDKGFQERKADGKFLNEKKIKKLESYIPPTEPVYTKKGADKLNASQSPSLEELKSKFMKKK